MSPRALPPAGRDRYFRYRAVALAVGAAGAVTGMALESEVLVGTALAVCLVGLALRLVALREREREQDREPDRE